MSTVFNEEIFSPSFPLDGSHLVAASAGTGKTYNIQNICARLVMERDLRVSQMLVVTFTEAATKELRDRIHKVLSNLLRLFAGDTKGMDEHELERLEKLCDCARTVLEKKTDRPDAVAKSRVELALLEFDQAAISTIHGFCRRTLARFAFETGGAFHADISDGGDAELMRRARDWWRVKRPSFPLKDLRTAVKELDEKQDWSIEDDPDAGEKDPSLVAAAEIVGEFEADRAVRDTLTYSDLLRSVRAALEDPVRGPTLAKNLRNEFRAVVIDEFQDTDPTQYCIFQQAFTNGVPAGERPPIFFVGDPKQAIYSFRGCDIFTYRKAVGEIGDDRTYWLDRNFRATPGLVDAVNHLFGDTKNPDGTFGRTFGDEAIPYEEDVRPATAEGERIEGLAIASDDGGFVEDPHPFRIVRAENATARFAAVVDAVLETLAEQKGKRIRIKGVEEPFGPKHIAILVTANAAGRDYCKALHGRGVPAIVSQSENVFAGETATEFRLVLAAMADGRDRRLIRTALATPFFEFPVQEMEKEDGTAFADKVGFFGDLNRTWMKRGFNAAFAKLEDGGGLRARFAALPDGERKLADLFQIVDLASAAIREKGPAPAALVDWITERINLSSGEGAEADADAYARELESDADAVRVVTVHKAKGLEYPVTIVPVPSSFLGNDENPPRFHHDQAGGLLVGKGNEAAAESAKEESAEKTRKLYVALTRATRRVVAVATNDPIPEFTSLLDNASRRDAGDDNPSGSPIQWSNYAPHEPPLPNYSPDFDDKVLAVAEVPRDYAEFRSKRKGSYSSLSPSLKDDGDSSGGNAADGGDGGKTGENDGFFRDEGDGVDHDSGDFESKDPLSTAVSTEYGEFVVGDEADEHPIFSIGGGARTGTCWHDILEKLPFDATDEMIRETTLRSMRLHGLARGDEKEVEDRVAAVSEMIRKTLDWSIVSPSGTQFKLSDVPMDRRFSEWEFDFSSAESVKTTEAIADILENEWKDDPAKDLFLKAVEKWNRQIPKGFLVGFLDLLFEHDGYYYVVDWKSNKLGGKVANFSAEGVKAEMAKEGYFFQYLLYSAVLHRFLKETLGPAYSWKKNFGGIRYYFLRGIAVGGNAPVFEDRPGENLLNRLCDALGLKD